MNHSNVRYFYQGLKLTTVSVDDNCESIGRAADFNFCEVDLGSNAVRLLEVDTQNSTVGVTGVDGQSLGITYSPYGDEHGSAGTRLRSRFTGESKLYESLGYSLGNGHRVYCPALMRFNRADTYSPFARGGLNAYMYCNGDPANRTDASGRFSIKKWYNGEYSYLKLQVKLQSNDPFTAFTKREYAALGNSLSKRLHRAEAKVRRVAKMGEKFPDEVSSPATISKLKNLGGIEEQIKLHKEFKLENNKIFYSRPLPDAHERASQMSDAELTRRLENFALNSNSQDSPAAPAVELSYEEMRVRLQRLRDG